MVRIHLWLGKYRILSVLNSSQALSSVYLAEQVRLEEKCIIKKIRKNHPFFHTMSREIQFLKLLKSKFIPLLYDVEEDEEALYFIMEFIEGMDGSSKVSDEKLFDFICQLVEFLAFLQEREDIILYLDWKPENLILAGENLKILDFGSARYLKEGMEGMALATDGFAAPELKCAGAVGTFTDIYGFGCLLKYFAEKMNERDKIFFRKSRKRRLLELSEECTKSNPEKRVKLDTIKKRIQKLKKEGLRAENNFSFNRIQISSKERIIGVSGTFRGVGVTHLSVLLALFLARQGKRVALVCFGYSHEEEDCLEDFQIKEPKLKVFKNITSPSLSSIFHRDFHHIIIDFGMARDGILGEFHRCDKRLVVFQFSKYKRKAELTILHQFSSGHGDRRVEFVQNLCEPGESNETKKILKQQGIVAALVEQAFEKIKE